MVPSSVPFSLLDASLKHVPNLRVLFTPWKRKRKRSKNKRQTSEIISSLAAACALALYEWALTRSRSQRPFHIFSCEGESDYLIFTFPTMYIVGQAMLRLNDRGCECYTSWSIDFVSLFAFVDLAETKHENKKRV